MSEFDHSEFVVSTFAAYERSERESVQVENPSSDNGRSFLVEKRSRVDKEDSTTIGA